MRQTWCAMEDSCEALEMLESVAESMPGSAVKKGRWQMGQSGWVGFASAVGVGDRDLIFWGDPSGFFCMMDRYLSWDVVKADFVGVGATDSRVVEGTNAILLRLMPAPNTRWSSRGMKYSSSSSDMSSPDNLARWEGEMSFENCRRF